MNRIWSFVIILSLLLLMTAGPELALSGMITAGNEALSLSLSLLGIYAVWLGILSIVEHTGLSDGISRLLRPLIRLLFGKDISPETEKYISVNMAANLIGMGGAATAMGIRAVNSMDTGGETATDAMIMLFVLNASGLQLIPATLIGLRTAAGSASPSDIMPPVIIATLASAALSVLLVKACRALSRRRTARRGK
jgi:spore maturation protein A